MTNESGLQFEKIEKTDAIVDAVCAKLQARSAVGLKKYGTTLADSPARTLEKLVHAQEEAMDLANYLEWLIQGLSYGTGPCMGSVSEMENFFKNVKVDGWWPSLEYQAALQSPQVPVIEEITEKIYDAVRLADKEYDGIHEGTIGTTRKEYTKKAIARAYAELQKGV